MSTELQALLASVDPDRPVVVLTGAGISAESGIPTFRGPEGYWSVGSEVYHPQQMATHAAFKRMPREVWRWYLYRWSVCRAAAPNDAHRAVAALEQGLGDRFWLVTQNVDGLHLRAGNSLARTCEVHGNIDDMRRADGRTAERLPLPPGLSPKGKDDPLTDAEWDLLVFPDGARARPHVLWFDEYYDEALYKSETAMRAASCGLLITVGTTASTSLPVHAVAAALAAGAALIDVNITDNDFAVAARDAKRGLALEGPAGQWMPRITELLLA